MDRHPTVEILDVQARSSLQQFATETSAMSGFLQKSDNKIPWLSMTIYTVFHDARKANTEDHMRIFITYTKQKPNLFLNLNYGLKKMICLLPNITICNLEPKPKASHSQIPAVDLDRCGIIGTSRAWFVISSREITWLFHYFFRIFLISMTCQIFILFHDCGNSAMCM